MLTISLIIFSFVALCCSVSFEECDTDLSRLLTRIELRACFQEEWGAGVMSEDRFIDLFDRDGDGGISSFFRVVVTREAGSRARCCGTVSFGSNKVHFYHPRRSG